MRRGRAAVALVGLVVAGCSYGQPRVSVSTATTTPVPRVAFVTIGSDATSGADVDDALHDLWSQRLFAAALPPQAVFVNLATRGATASDALREQVPVALELHPTIVTVWLTGDLDAGTPAGAYEADLTRVIEQMQAAGATVLVAQGRPFDPVADRVAARTGATPVDLSGVSAGVAGSDAEQTAIASAFEPALRVPART